MDSISLDWEAAVADPVGTVSRLRRVEEETAEFLARVGAVRTKLEALGEAPWAPPAAAPSGTPPPPADAPSAKSATGAAGAGGEQVTRRAQVLDLLGHGGEREWNVREIGEAIGQPNLRSLRVLAEDLVHQGLLTRRTVLPRSVLYRRPGIVPPQGGPSTSEVFTS
ncbi:hypothetical protein PUR28_27835 [Streptomyces sp. BE308]|uniref:hypothetical protein n=1 Tax=Streptomyces sp. BE308 TaxID=3002529 RepID=UPI002E76408E|nr:hypothetical protein [Streptomyces sp. BE308]MEE1794540.1 hypothetical protein [Streptomyces sp. BE308]